MKILIIGITSLAYIALIQNTILEAQTSDPWVLTNAQRQAFLHYYSPIILKRGDENNESIHRGHDWITNFNFDQDGNFSNNRQTWRDEKHKYIDNTSHAQWKINPTLYTAVIEFMLKGQKSLVLLYHIYHAYQGGDFNTADIHDWERIEVRIDDVQNSGPGQGEKINYYVLTRHDHHDARVYGHSDLHFVENVDTPSQISGKHLLVWQAKWRGTRGLRKAELHYVQNGLHDFINDTAEVDITKTGERPFHYIFVNGGSPQTAEFFNATPITYQNASTKYSGLDDDTKIHTSQTKRITYELQDLADILPTHWVHANGTNTNINWKNPIFKVNLETPIESRVTGQTISVPPGIQSFLRKAKNGDRLGYINKGWFWGTYYWDGEGNWTEHPYKNFNPFYPTPPDNPVWNPYHKNGEVWNQHDYYAHRHRVRINRWRNYTFSQWLPSGWHKEENGGFDGRWIGLFPKTEV